METKRIDWVKNGVNNPITICPVCNHVWFIDDEEGPGDFTPCSHLRFAWVSAAGIIEYFGDWDTGYFEDAYRKAAIEVFGDADLLRGRA